MIVGALLLCFAQGAGALRAETLWDQGRREEAIADWERALDRAPDDRELRRRLVDALLSVHRYSGALDAARALGADGAAVRGFALFRLGRHEEALLELPRSDDRSLILRIDAAEALGRFDESDAALDALVKRTAIDDPRLPTLLGKRALRRGEFELARQSFERALRIDPCDPAALFGLGRALVKLGKREEALRYLDEHRRVTPLLDQLDFAQRAVDLAPHHAANVAAVGDAERALGRIDRAESAYARATLLANRAEELTPIALRHARLLCEDRHDIRAGVKLLDAAAQRVSDPRLLVRAGELWMQLGDRKEAATRLERALQLNPGDREIQRRLDAARAP